MSKKEKDFWVIGIGASAGGLEALSTFFRSVRPHPQAAFIVAQHLAPHSKSMMVELISRQTPLPVVAVKDHQVLEAGHIYIVPPNHDVSIEDCELSLTEAGVETRPKPSVDYFFQSLAKAFQRRAVGIILSGTGSDGAEGIRAIKENGGITLAQSHETAKYDGMPKTSIETGMVDEVMSAEELGDQLFTLLEQREKEPEFLKPIEEIDYLKVVKFLKKEIGADFSQYKMSTIQRRIEKRMSSLGKRTVKDYYTYLENNPGEFSLLAQEMLVSVTSFFRDEESFEALRGYLDEIIEKKTANEEIRIWSAGCATGEEPYSIAFLLCEIFGQRNKSLPIKIFATDLDQEALAQARSGYYKNEDVADLPREYVEKYFDKRENHYEVKKHVREMIVFARQDLVQNPPFVKLDLITCRNVLIYFEGVLQNRVFDVFHYALNANGYLFLGKSETAKASLFESIDKKHKIYKKMHSVHNLGQPAHRYTLNSASAQAQKSKARVDSSIASNAMLQLLKQFNLSAVVVDEDSIILHIIGVVTDFIGLPAGMADFRLSNLLPKTSATEFTVLLKKSLKENQPVKSRQYKLEKATKKNFCFTIQPLENSQDSYKKLFLVSFELKKIDFETSELNLVPTEIPRRVLELEQEVAATKENLQTVIEELEISNEELQSLNEELSSTNEELQASNEELETTNEEMQSTNEELTTLNEELNTKSAELRIANTSLENILSSISSPMLVIDSNTRIQRYNEQISQIFHITMSDIGNPISRASCHCEIMDFEKNIRETIKTGKVNELKCETSQRFFQIRVHPNRDENNEIIGAIIIFFDNTEILSTQERLIVSDKRIRSIIDGTPALIFLKDAQGKYLSANKAFETKFNIKEADILGKTDRDIFFEDVANQFREGDLEVIFKRSMSERQEDVVFEDKKSSFYVSRFPLFGNNDKNPYAVGTVAIDITSQKKMQNELEASEGRYKAIIEDQAVFVSRHGRDGHFTFTNRAFCNYFGGSGQSNQGLKFLSIVDEADKKKVSQEIAKLNIESPIVQYEHRVKNHTPSPVRWVRWIHRALFNEQNEIVEYQAVGFDTTEIHNKTVELLEKETIFSQVLEHTSDYLSVYKYKDGDLYLESFNQSTGKSKNYTPNHFLGMKLDDLIDPKNQAEIRMHYDRCLRDKVIVAFDEEVQGPGGSRFLANTLVPVMNEDNQVIRIVAISKDISKLKRTELALRDEKLNAEAANKAKSDFLASMSHELRTPLNVIMGMSQLLGRSQIRPEQLKLVESISRSSKVLLSLIEDVLDLSRIEAGKVHFEVKPFSLSLLTHDVMQSFETLAKEKKISLKVEEDFDSELILQGDQVRLKQILINLLGNAIKFTEDGSVTLRIQAYSKVSSAPVSIYFEVKDTGIGIEEEAFGKIFKRFSQADSGSARKFGGTGLGLSISKQLVELMHGSIGFESKKGEGSTFWFQIQLKKASKVDHDLEVGTTNFNLKGKKILAVDDSPESLKVLELMLKESGGEVYTASSGQEALEVVMGQNLDVVLMDMQMPGMDGLETTKKIRQLNETSRKLPIIALTANAMPGDRERCINSGMNDYTTKPVQMNILHFMINKWVQKV